MWLPLMTRHLLCSHVRFNRLLLSKYFFIPMHSLSLSLSFSLPPPSPSPSIPLLQCSQCLPYTHSTCSPFLVDNDVIFVDASVSSDVKMLQLQEQVESLFRTIEQRTNGYVYINLGLGLGLVELGQVLLH